MSDSIRHRGPDDSGVWVDAQAGIALGHRRLSIVDLSPEGHQPMTSRSGRYVMVFNGEVYNYLRIRRELAEPDDHYRGHSDTEVMLAAIERWGVAGATRRFIGMFAFALWDRQERKLSLVRDRLGIKPLYYSVSGGALVFGSELRTLARYPVDRSVNPQAVSALLATGTIPAPLSIYRGTHKQMPGTILEFRASSLEQPTVHEFWSAADVARQGVEAPFRGSLEEAVDELESTLKDAVQLRMIADVPLGAFLSGGIDSSTVVALMQAQSTRRVRTFSIGFSDREFNESVYGRQVADVLGTDHTELEVTGAEALAVVPQLPAIYDEPFADSSQIPTYLVSKLARENVTVALSGDGGDELFGGYNRHVWLPLVWAVARRVPPSLREAVGRQLMATSPEQARRAYSHAERLLPRSLHVRLPTEKLKKLGTAFACKDELAMYERMTMLWQQPERVLTRRVGQGRGAPPVPASLPGARARMMFRDLVDYLPNDILTKVDRASMAVALEARVPLLDHRVVEFAWRLPESMKVRGTRGKFILRRLLSRYVPEHLFERPKMGFSVPLAAWLRGPLREWSEVMLGEDRLRRDGLLEPGVVREAWTEHLSGVRDRHEELWIVLMLNAWLDAERGDGSTACVAAE